MQFTSPGMHPSAMECTISGAQPRPVKTPRRCKACQPCQERKTKCDGQQPSCALCLEHGYACKYAEDRRQTARVTKAAISTVHSKIASLERVIKALEDLTQRQGLVIQELNLTRPFVPSIISTDPVEARLTSPTSTLNPLRTPATYAENDSTQQLDAREPIDYVTSVDEIRAVPQDGVLASSGMRDAPEGMNRAGEPWNASASPSSTRGFERQPAASQDKNDQIIAGLNMRVSNSVHGLTSTFHPRPFSPKTSSHISLSVSSAENTSENQVSQTQQPREHGDDEVRARLFMYGALQRQKEYAYMTERKYDLDGVDYETAMHLLDLHWNHQHCAYLFSYRPAIMHSLATGGPHANMLLLNALYYSSSLNSSRDYLREVGPDGRPAKNRFLVRFQELLLPELERSSIPNAVAFLQMGSSLFASGEQTAGWLYSGIGYRMIIDLGLHLDLGKIQTTGPNNSTTDETAYFVDVELQRRVFWGAYVNDKFQSLFFGRSPALPATGAEPPQILSDTYEELELWAPYVDPQDSSPLLHRYTPRPGYVVSTFTWLLRLAEISSEITEYLYMPTICKMKRSIALEHFRRIRNNLDRWNEDLPVHLRFDPEKDPPPPTHQFNIHTTYHTLCILLHRPFLPEGHLKHFSLDEKSTQEVCISAALKIYRLAKAYRDTFTLRRAPYLFSYALFSAATVIPNHETSGWGHLARKDITIFFWNALIELQNGSNFGLRRPIKIIRDFMERSGVDIHGLATRLETPPKSPAAASSVIDSGEADDPHNFSSDAGFRFDNNELRILDLNLDNMDWLNDGTVDSSFRESDNMLYGLFRPS